MNLDIKDFLFYSKSEINKIRKIIKKNLIMVLICKFLI